MNNLLSCRFQKAKEKFKTAGKEATRAFSNPALSTEDKILATKLRITCSILEGIQDIKAAIKAAVMYLDRLHDLPAIQEAFSVYLEGGLRSMFSKNKRLEIVQAVSIINHELFYFARVVMGISTDLFAWPKIKLTSREYQPVLRDTRISLTEFGISAKGPYTTSFSSVKVIPPCSTINSKGDVIAQIAKATIFIFFAKPAGMSDRHKKLCSIPEDDEKKPGFAIECMTIDANDNLYIITINEQSQNKLNLDYMLYIFDSCGVLKHKCLLGFMNPHWVFYDRASIVVNKLGQIVMNKVEDKQIYIFDANGQLLRKFPDVRAEDGILSTVYLTSSDTNEIITAQYDQNAVFIYTVEGKYNRAFHAPKEHKIAGIGFNHITKSIILQTSMRTKSFGQMYLLSYGPNAEEPQMLQLDDVSSIHKLTSHPNGLVALITPDGVIFI